MIIWTKFKYIKINLAFLDLKINIRTIPQKITHLEIKS